MSTKDKKSISLAESLEKQYGEITFGDLLEAIRESNEVSQEEMAKNVGLSRANYNDIIKGRRIPSPERAARIAKRLGHLEIGFVQLCLRDALRKAGFNYKVKLESA